VHDIGELGPGPLVAEEVSATGGERERVRQPRTRQVEMQDGVPGEVIDAHDLVIGYFGSGDVDGVGLDAHTYIASKA
jgi:hypothetical protein